MMATFPFIYIHSYIIINQIQMSQAEIPQITTITQQYLSKMQQIAQNQPHLPIRYFQQAQLFIRSQSLQSLPLPDEFHLAQKSLLQWRQQFWTRNNKAICKWSGQLLTELLGGVDRKMWKEIKSFNTYRQEMQNMMEMFRKKVQPYITVQLLQMQVENVCLRMFQHSSQLHGFIVGQIQEQNKAQEAQNRLLTAECKEARRKLSKEETENQRAMAEMREKLSLLDTKYSLLQENHQQLQKELQQCTQSKQEAINRLKEEHNAETTQLRQKVEELSQRVRQSSKRITQLQNELKKQKLLHQQTSVYYQQLIDEYHNKQQQLKEQILQVSRVSQQEFDLLKVSSTRRIEDYHYTTKEMQDQLRSLEDLLARKEKELKDTRDELTIFKQKSRREMQKMENQIIDIEVKNKALQQNEAIKEQLRVKLQKAEGQLKKCLRERQTLHEACKEGQKQRLILQQKLQYSKLQLQEQRVKHKAVSEDLQKKQSKLQQAYQKPPRCDTGTQADDGVRQKLRAALFLIKQMQADILQLRSSYQRNKKGARANLP